MRQDMNLPDGTYGVPDPDHPHVMTLWWVHKGKLKTWPKGVRYAPFPPKTPADLIRAERGEWRTAWYDSVYWVWKHAVIDAIAADLDTARERFAEHVPEDERPVIPTAGKKPKPDKVRAEEIQAGFLAVVHGLSVDAIAEQMKLPHTTAWRRIQDGTILLGKIQDVIDRVKETEARSPWLVAADLMDAQSDQGGGA
jgi:hypothetical protein